MKNNREILTAIQTLIQDFNLDESPHEAVILVGMTTAENPTLEKPYQSLVGGAGKSSDVAEMFLNLLKFNPIALPAVELAMSRLAMERKADFLIPLIQSVFLPLRQNVKPKTKIIGVPNRIIKPGQHN